MALHELDSITDGALLVWGTLNCCHPSKNSHENFVEDSSPEKIAVKDVPHGSIKDTNIATAIVIIPQGGVVFSPHSYSFSPSPEDLWLDPCR